jgi:hypothetical protein
MISVYIDSQILQTEWIPFLRFPGGYKIYFDFEEYRDSYNRVKLAFTTHRLHCDYDKNSAAYQGFEDKIIKLSDASDLVFSFESELHNYHWEIWHYCHRPNVYWCQPGRVNDQDQMQENLIYWGDWFKTTANLYRALPEVLNQLHPYELKPRVFDALLGCPKPHRTFVADAVKKYNLHDKFILTYGGAWNNSEFYAQDYFIWEPGCEPSQPIIGTADWVNYRGQQCHLSQVIPTQVYNDTAYSIVAETDYDNTLSFFSEKTAKAFIARRLFVAFSGYKFLQNLKKLGFKTFDSVIDESYDNIHNDRERYEAAFEQVQKLCQVSQHEVLETVKPVLEHNHNLIMNTDWNQSTRSQIQNLIDQICK